MGSFEYSVLKYIDCVNNVEEDWQNIQDLFNDNKIATNKYDLELLLHFILSVSNNYHRSVDFFQKIEKILLLLKEDIIRCFSNTTIFNIFKSNKRILLFLIDEKILTINKYIADVFMQHKYQKMNYPQYFYIELEQYIDKRIKHEFSVEISDYKQKYGENYAEKYNEKRRIGENDDYICELIRNDDIEEFIIYTNKNNISLNSKINYSIFETNSFLIKQQIYDKSISLLEYASFFGSIQIFKYLKANGAQLTPSLCIYAVHGRDAELIHFFENPTEKDIQKMYEESIICHHNGEANHILYFYNKTEIKTSKEFNLKLFKYYNFAFIDENLINETTFYKLCQYSYCTFVEFLLKSQKIEINKIYIPFLFNL